MTNPKPVVVALPLDHQTDELLATALDLGQRLKCPLVVVHALGKRRECGFRVRQLRCHRASPAG